MSHRLQELKDKFKKDGGEFVEYPLQSQELFIVEGTKSLDEGKLSFVENGINFVGRVSENNGVKGKIRQQKFEPNQANTITATVIGNYKYVKFQKEQYYCSQNINKLVPNFEINESIALYLLPHIQKFVSQYNEQQGGYRLEELKLHKIQLPTKNSQIDFNYMEKYIHVLETERVHVLETYLQASGLDTYTLTKEEQEAYDIIYNGKKRVKLYAVQSLFSIRNTHSILQSLVRDNSGSYPYVTASDSNNAVSTYISYNKDYLEEGNSIMIGGKTLVITYQKEDYFSNDSHNLALYLKQDEMRTESKQLFLVSALLKTLKPKYSWGDSISRKKIQDDYIMLPVNQNDEIDYEFMETYIRAIEKKVIKNVVDWKDKEIERTKDVVSIVS